LEAFVQTQVESAFSPVARSFTTVELEHHTTLLQAMAAAHIDTWTNGQLSNEERTQSIMANSDAQFIMQEAWQRESQEDDALPDVWDNMDLRNFVLAQAAIHLEGGTASSHVERFYADEFQRAYVQVQRSTSHHSDLTSETLARAILANRQAASIMSTARFGSGSLETGLILDVLYEPTSTRNTTRTTAVPTPEIYVPPTATNPPMFTRNRRNLRTQPEAFYQAALQEYTRCAAPDKDVEPAGRNWFDPSSEIHQSLISPLLKVGSWARYFLSRLPGAGPLVGQHAACPYTAQDFALFLPLSQVTPLPRDIAPLDIVVAGFPLHAGSHEVQARLRQLGIDPLHQSVAMSTDTRKYKDRKADSLVDTAYATMQVPHSIVLWQLIQGQGRAYFEDTPDTTDSHALSLWVDDRSLENILRMNIIHTAGKPRMTLPAIMHAVGFQQEDFRRIGAWILRQQGIPAVTIRMFDVIQARPGNGNRIQARILLPWYSYHGGLEVVLPSKEAYADFLATSTPNRKYTMSLHSLYDLMTADEQDAFRAAQPDLNMDSLKTFALEMTVSAKPVATDKVTRIPSLLEADQATRIVYLFPTSQGATAIKNKHGNTLSKMRTNIRDHARRSGVQVEEVIVSYFTDSDTWFMNDGIALIMPSPEAARQYWENINIEMNRVTKVWEPLSGIKPDGTVLSSQPYRASTTSDVARTKRKRSPPHNNTALVTTTSNNSAPCIETAEQRGVAIRGGRGGASSRTSMPARVVSHASASAVPKHRDLVVRFSSSDHNTATQPDPTPSSTALVPAHGPIGTSEHVLNISSQLHAALSVQSDRIVKQVQDATQTQKELVDKLIEEQREQRRAQAEDRQSLQKSMQSLMEMAQFALAAYAVRGPAGSPGSTQPASNSTSAAPTGATGGSPPQHAGAPGSRASSVQPDTSAGPQALTRASSTGSSSTRVSTRRTRKETTEEEHEGTSSSSQPHD
jgi:hypothetical protein